MEFTLAVLICIVGLAVAAPATKTETTSSKIAPGDQYTHPKLELFQEQNYTLDDVLEILQQESEEQHRNPASLKKTRCDK